MKILIVSPFDDERSGGVGIAVKRLSEALVRGGDEVFILTSGQDDLLSRGRISTLDGSTIRLRPKPTLTYWGSYGPAWTESSEVESLVEILSSIPIDLIHVHHLIHMGTDLLPILRRSYPDKPIIYTHHDGWAICQAEGQLLRRDTGEYCMEANPFRCAQCCRSYGNEIDMRIVFVRNQLSRKVHECVDVHTAPSEYFASRIGRDLKVEVVFLPNIPPIDLDRSKTENIVPSPKRRSRIGFFGQLVETKGLLNLINAIDRYNKDHPLGKVSLDIHGDGPLRDEIIRLATGSTQISYKGPYRASEVARKMNSVDWVAVPSYWPENAPVVITEALAAGIPVIVASLGGKQELVDFELNAIKVDGDLEIDWVEAFARTQGVDSNLLWTRLSENCRNKNDFDTALKLTKKLYQSAIKNSLVKFEV